MAEDNKTKPEDADKQVKAHIEHDAAQYADFLAARDRLLGRMNAAKADISRLRSTVAETRRDYDIQIAYLRRQVEAVHPKSPAKVNAADAPPPSTATE